MQNKNEKIKKIKEALENIYAEQVSLEEIYNIAKRYNKYKWGDLKMTEGQKDEMLAAILDLLEEEDLLIDIDQYGVYYEELEAAENLEEVENIEEQIKADLEKKEEVEVKINDLDALFKKGLNLLREIEDLEKYEDFLEKEEEKLENAEETLLNENEIENAIGFVRYKKDIEENVYFVNRYLQSLLLVKKGIESLENYENDELGELLKQKKEQQQTQEQVAPSL